MSDAASKAQESEEKYDDSLFYEQMDYYNGLALGFMHDLIENTPRNTNLAHVICRKIEAGNIGHSELSKTFPKRRRNHADRLKSYTKVRGPLDQEKRKLLREIKALEGVSAGEAPESGGEAEVSSGTELSSSIRDQVDMLSQRLAEIDLQLLEVKAPGGYKPYYRDDGKQDKTKAVTAHDWAYLKDWFGRKRDGYLKHEPEPLYKNLMALCDYLKLEDTHKQLLVLLLCYEKVPPLEKFVDSLSSRNQKGYNAIAARMLGVDPARVSAMFSFKSPLIENGLIVPDMDGGEGLPQISSSMEGILSEQDISFEEIIKRMIGEPVTTDLDWDRDFGHLGAAGEELIKILQGARDMNEPGVNLLLYGLQDAGKTEAVKAACKKAGITLYAVGEKCEDFDSGEEEPLRQDRMAQAMLAQSLLANQPNAAILFDEMEDLLPGSGIDGGGVVSEGASKVYLNRMLEKNRTITFWTANDIKKFHPAVRRRMRFSVQFEVPPASVREEMWKNISAKYDFALAAEECRKLGREYKAPPGMITTAVKNAKLTGGSLASIHTSLRASAELVFGSRHAIESRESSASDRYDISLLNATVEGEDFDIDGLTQDILHSPYRDISMLLYGPPGTGKSEYVRYLAKVLDMEVSLKRASDILSKWHGETEQNIAQAFSDARENKHFLIIDEADSLLHDRAKVDHQWQIPIINEMLTWLESHPLPVAFTTNMTDNLDPASKRRFAFKLKCDYMKPAQVAQAFRTFFDREPPAELSHLSMLTPGDFAAVKRQMKFARREISSAQIVAMLEHEIKLKNDHKQNPIGFMTELFRQKEAGQKHLQLAVKPLEPGEPS